MTTMTTQDERPAQDDRDDVLGYIWPLIWAAEIAIGAAVVIGFSGPDLPSGSSGGKSNIGATCPV